MAHRPLILLTNDDGIASPGLKASARALAGLGELLVVAPATQQTAMGRSLTGRRDARLEPVPFAVEGSPLRAFACEGSPAAVLRHGLQALCGTRKPDLVVSGINYGENVGTSVTASGTVGAALEAASRGIPALAAALQVPPQAFLAHGAADWGAAQHFLRRFAARMLASPMPFDVDLLKLDIPADATPDTPWRLCRQSRQPYVDAVLKDPGPESRLGDGELRIRVDAQSLEPDSDIHALVHARAVAVTPLSLDATSRTAFPALQALLAAD